MHPQAGTEEFPGLHNPKYTEPTNSLHRVGEKLSLCVRSVYPWNFYYCYRADDDIERSSAPQKKVPQIWTRVKMTRTVFTPIPISTVVSRNNETSYDHLKHMNSHLGIPLPLPLSLQYNSTNATFPTASEIANLKREAEELKNIRGKMASPGFAAAIFDKVFCADITRLRSMEDMWKSRKPPKVLDRAAVEKEAKGVSVCVAKSDQKVWGLAENYAVFADGLRRLAIRMLELKAGVAAGEAPPILMFDKDDEDTLDFVAASANLRSLVFGIDVKSKFDIKRKYFWVHD